MSDRMLSRFGRWIKFGRRNRRSTSSVTDKEKLKFESLESRAMLAVTTDVPSIQGTVYIDANQDSSLTAGEERTGVTVELYTDDGDGVFETNSEDVLFGTLVSDSSGEYCFNGLDGTKGYFLVQPAQQISNVQFARRVSNLIQPGNPNLTIDAFTSSQSAQANPPAPSSDGSTLLFVDENEVLGGERDMYVELISGVGEVQFVVNPFDQLPVLQFNSSSGVQGQAVMTWDGQDNSSDPTPAMGLNGRDLTQGGVNTGIGLKLGIDAAGAGEVITFRIYQGNATNFSTASAPIPVTDGSATSYLFIPFTSFSGPVNPTDVDAIQMELGNGDIPSADAQIDFIGVVGPSINNIANDAGVDLSITKSNVTDTVPAGGPLSYTILVQNEGPLAVTGATVADTFPSQLTNATYTSTTTGTVSGNTASGSGNISDTVNISAGGSITYTVSGTLASSATGTITNNATVTAPNTVTELDLTNNTDDEQDAAVTQVDLSITKTDGVTTARTGDTLTYTIVVTNGGPSDVAGATVTDTFPAELANVSYTSVVTGTVTGNTVSGTGNISDTVNMAAGATITYTVTATVADTGADQVVNVARVNAPEGVTETDPNDNQATDTDDIPDEMNLTITKTDNVTTAVPGLTLTYQIVVSNAGPRAATGATVQDTFPANLTDITYTSVAIGGATGNTASGSGNLNEVVNLPVNGQITYTVSARVLPSATGTVVNVAQVSPPTGAIETDSADNTATDTDTLTPNVDLQVTKTDGVTSAGAGDVLHYTIVVTNSGPSNVVGATVTDTFPAQLTNITYTSSVTGGATGNTASGSNNLSETLTLPVGATVTYQVSATVLGTATSDIVNTVQVNPPAGTTETNNVNNTATDTDTLIPSVDLSVTKTNNVTSVTAGRNTTYTIVVANAGPGTATGATVADTFPTLLSNVTYTSVATGGATGNTASGSNALNDLVTLPPNSSITYTVQGLVDINSAGQSLQNSVTVTPPTTVRELNNTNNTATDTDPIDELLAQLSGTVYVDQNNNGVRDTSERGIAGVAVALRQNNAQVSTTTTDSNGAYSFTNLVRGDYSVVETQPTNFQDGQESAAGGQGTVAGNDQFNVTLGPGDNVTQLNFGEISLQPSKRDLLASRFAT